jgi:hypothetical protein
LKFDAIVVKCIPGKEVIWQMRKFLRLPVWLVIEFEDNEKGTLLIHTIKAGYLGTGRFLDGLFKLFFNEQFGKDMDEHARIEFRKLAVILS